MQCIAPYSSPMRQLTPIDANEERRGKKKKGKRPDPTKMQHAQYVYRKNKIA